MQKILRLLFCGTHRPMRSPFFSKILSYFKKYQNLSFIKACWTLVIIVASKALQAIVVAAINDCNWIFYLFFAKHAAEGFTYKTLILDINKYIYLKVFEFHYNACEFKLISEDLFLVDGNRIIVYFLFEIKHINFIFFF